jgi:hypothetical protein
MHLMIAEKTEKTSGSRSLNLSYLIGFEPVTKRIQVSAANRVMCPERVSNPVQPYYYKEMKYEIELYRQSSISIMGFYLFLAGGFLLLTITLGLGAFGFIVDVFFVASPGFGATGFIVGVAFPESGFGLLLSADIKNSFRVLI